MPGKPNDVPPNGFEANERESSRALGIGDVDIDTVIQMHLLDCDECRHAIENLKPKGIGQKTGLCDTYLHLQMMRANYEGAVNNVVAHTEYGDEAPKGRPLE